MATNVLKDTRPKPAGRRGKDYTAKDIEVLEGLEPVRRRPAMFIGGTDERAMQHLAVEALDNAMDEAIAGHASRIELELAAENIVIVRDNGRGIPVDPHPKFKGKSALEVILTTLHSGGKFGGEVYASAGGLHGVGLSVVNALSDHLSVDIARDNTLWTQSYTRGKPKKLERKGPAGRRRGTTITFHPDPEIFGERARFQPARLYELARAKAYLFRGVEIRWSCDRKLLKKNEDVPEHETLHFPGGLADYLTISLDGRQTVTEEAFVGAAKFPNGSGRAEWAIAWPVDAEGLVASHCNTVPTPLGGTHEAGLRAGLSRGLKTYGELIGNRRAAQITTDDVVGGAYVLLSVFLTEPEFQGQTKEKLTKTAATRLVDAAIKDHFDHWLSGNPEAANALLENIIDRAEERQRRRQEKEVARKRLKRRLRLPGKLADCMRGAAKGTEVFLVEGDSAGGSAKQARNRETQAILPLRGKILNVASATADKQRANRELSDLVLALGCGSGASYVEENLRYERVIIMTDADVDGAHIASLLMTFFYREMRALIENGHLHLAQPPLYRLTRGAKTVYARDDAHRDALLGSEFPGKGKVEISRFKGLGEMPSAQLRETTMDPAHRVLLRVELANGNDRKIADHVERLMGRKPEGRFKFIQERAEFVTDLDI